MARTPRRVREEMPARYLALEEQRLARLITAWLDYERLRAEFEVAETELARPVVIAGLALELRLDRLDRLNDGTFLVVDYKTGAVADRAWDGDRPEDLQLPVYAGFGLEDGQDVSGLVFAKVQTGKDLGFAGRVGDALGTLLPDLGRTCALVKRPFEAEQLVEWRDEIETLARAFLAGRADVDPRDPPKTCERCGLHVLCRIQEREPAFSDDEVPEEDADA
jgi:ATP-dependent helicase/nuclease subunit B